MSGAGRGEEEVSGGGQLKSELKDVIALCEIIVMRELVARAALLKAYSICIAFVFRAATRHLALHRRVKSAVITDSSLVLIE